jgi:hypothetical protein
MNVRKFVDLRESIEGLNEEIKPWIRQKSISESYKRLEESRELLKNLRNIAEGEIQNRSVERLTFDLEAFARQIDEILSKREAGKKEAGNIAFKCNWNDKYYKAPCSLEAYNFNITAGRAWCNSPLSKCRTFNDNVSLNDYPCYESIALKEMYFAAGWDFTGDKIQKRKIHSAKRGKMALLTTRPPGVEEQDRLIVGCLFIKTVLDDPGEETKIFGDRTKSFEIDYDEVKVKFWDYYKNKADENLILWASGLFRYVSDETVLNILKGIGEQYKNSGKDVKKIIGLIRYYEG